jgi:hypothetical protein
MQFYMKEVAKMLKKVSLMMIVLLASTPMAHALLQISVNGEQGPNAEITLGPSNTAMLDIYADEELTTTNTPVQYAMIVQEGPATITAANANAYNDAGPDWFIFVSDLRDISQPVGTDNGMWGNVTLFSGTAPLGSTLIDQIGLHCDGPGDVLIKLIDCDPGSGEPTGLVYDTLIVHQIPEPATLALLGLGGLLLRRKTA